MAETADRALLLIMKAASDALDTPIEELPPLSESINPDGLDAIVSHSQDAEVTVTFSYAGLRVFVHSEGFVYVRPAWKEGEPELDGTFVHRR